MPNIMPGFDREIAKLAQRLLVNGRHIDFHTNVMASKVTPGGCAAQCGMWQAGQGRQAGQSASLSIRRAVTMPLFRHNWHSAVQQTAVCNPAMPPLPALCPRPRCRRAGRQAGED